MKTILKTGDILSGQSRANSVLRCVTTMSINKKQISKLLSYMTTFDGGVYQYGKAKNAQFIMNMREENLDYMEWVKSVLENITGVRLTERKDYNVDGCKRAPQLRLESQRHPFLTKLRERIYIDNHKVIDPHMLKMMDAEALAIIFMCDGHSSLDTRFKNTHCKITLETKGFSYSDNLALSKSIYEATNIRTNVQRSGKYYLLYVKTKDHKLFVETVMPHILPSFMYKLERIAPASSLKQGDEIVWPSVKAEEEGRDDPSL